METSVVVQYINQFRATKEQKEIQAHHARRRIVEGFIEALVLCHHHHQRGRCNDLLQEVDATAKEKVHALMS